MLEHLFALQQYTANTVDGGRHLQAVKLTDILMASGSKIVALILVKTQVEFSPMLNHRGIERTQQYMVLIVQFRYRHHQQTMVFSRVAVHQRGARIGSRTIASQDFLFQGVLKIRHLSLVKT